MEKKNPNAVALGALGGRPSIRTPCPRCGELQPSARAAWRHCREPASVAAKKVWATKKAGKKATKKAGKKKAK